MGNNQALFRVSLHVRLINFDLARLSGYLEPQLGRAVKTGQLNLESRIRIRNNRIDVENSLLIRKLELEQPRQPAADAALAGGMALDMALGMLQDNRGDIELDMPIRGALDDPDIDPAHLINRALVSSLKAGAITYAALALQPYGSLMLVADLAHGLIQDTLRPALTPVRFAERAVALSAPMRDYISKVAALVKQKDFRLQVCGVATRNEAQASDASVDADGQRQHRVQPATLDDAQLLELAQRRADAVMAALRAAGVADQHVFNCRPRIDASAQSAGARVELLLDD